jgi:PAS domain S-box-containing protein
MILPSLDPSKQPPLFSELQNSDGGNLLEHNFDDETPSLIFNGKYGMVILANEAMWSLLETPVEETRHVHIRHIFPLFDETVIEDHSFYNLDLVTANGAVYDCGVSVDFITTDGETLLLRIRRKKLKTSPLTKKPGGRFGVLLSLAKLIELPTLESAEKRAVSLISRLLNANAVGIYWVDDKRPLIRLSSSSQANGRLPVNLPISDIHLLSQPIIWRKDRQLPSFDSEWSPVLDMNFLIAIPIFSGEGIIGFVLAGDAAKEPLPEINWLVEYVRVVMGTIVAHFLSEGNLRKEIQRLSTLVAEKNVQIQSLRDAVIMLSNDGCIIDMNSAAELLLGFSLDDVLGRPVEDVVIAPSIFSTSLDNAMNSTPIHDIGVIEIHHRTGFSIPVKMELIPILHGSKTPKIMVLMKDMSEITEISLRSEQLEHRALLGEFIAAFAHDARNPINNITSSLQLLTHQLPENDPNRQIVSRLEEDCERLSQMMESFLSFSRLVDSRNFVPVDLVALLERITNKWKPNFDNQGIIFTFTVEGQIPTILGDKRSLERVFVNLISNAVEAMEANDVEPVLGVKISVNGEQKVEITVADNGKGMPVKILDQIFTPFFSTKSKGTGLGLAISKQIITAHHGVITVESFPGGTIFQVKLPVEEKHGVNHSGR